MASEKSGASTHRQLIADKALPRTRMKQFAFRVFAVGFSMTACCLILEIALRISGPEYHRFHWRSLYYSNPRGYFDLLGEENGRKLYGIPESACKENRKRVADGEQSEKEVHTFLARENDVLVLGDSFTFGVGVRYDDIYARQLEKLLAGAGRPLRIDNSAYPGYDLEEIVGAYESASGGGRRFPLTIYGFVLNDFNLCTRKPLVGFDYIDLDRGGNRPSSWREHSALLNFIGHRLDAIQTDRVTRKAYLDAFEGENAQQHFAMLADLNRQVEADGGRLVVMLFPLLYEFDNYPFQGIHDKIADFCAREDIPMLDLLPAYSEYDAEDLWVHPVDHHPNEIGHRIAAEELHTFLKRKDLLPPSRAAEREILTPDGDASTE